MNQKKLPVKNKVLKLRDEALLDLCPNATASRRSVLSLYSFIFIETSSIFKIPIYPNDQYFSSLLSRVQLSVDLWESFFSKATANL